jgi:asparagine synthase (glutamine-hydrolysing)
MCGIAGIATSADAQFPDLRERLEAMAHAMLHRGPDDGGIYTSPEGLVGLANRRLAIRDLSPAGHMPMTTPDGFLTITYNGEIYNAVELRAELERKGFGFRSTSDTEVILHGYRQWAEDIVNRLRGMFAFCIYDRVNQRLYLARDALGIKPLYYCYRGNKFAFASECKALIRGGVAISDLSPAGLVAYLELGSVPAPLTIYRDIRSLEAGQCMRVEADLARLKVEAPRTYWRLPPPACPPLVSYADTVDRVHSLLLDSVRRHLVSDVPLGAFLSGGIDSSAIVALMREASPAATIRTCSVTFEEREFDESLFAREVADRFGADHVEVLVTAEDVTRNLDGAIQALDQPSNDGINTYFVSKAARRAGLTVSLSGVGGDELFGGYPTFERLPRLARLARAPGAVSTASIVSSIANPLSGAARLADWLQRDGGSPAATYLGLRGLFSPAGVQQLVRPDVLAEARSDFNLLRLVGETPYSREDLWDAASRLEISCYMRHQLLRDVDVMSMAHSLEVRVPYVDAALASTVLELPGALRAGGSHKQLLRDAVWQIPDCVRQRHDKQGFTLPFSRWMAGPLRVKVCERVRGVTTALRDVLDQEAVEGTLAALDAGRVHWSRVWALAALATAVPSAVPHAQLRQSQVGGRVAGSVTASTNPIPERCEQRQFEARLAQSVASVLPSEPSGLSCGIGPARHSSTLGKVLGVFSTTEQIGGIQTAGRIAWEGLQSSGVTSETRLFCYCAKPWPMARRLSRPSTVHVGTKLSAAATALRLQWDADLILVWHIGVLPLVPLFRRRRARVAVALFGLEAWRELDPRTCRLLKQCDLLIPVSDYTWARIAAANPSLANLPHATVHLGIAEPAAPEELRPPDGRPIALMVSRLSESDRYKGHHEVIRCWPAVRGRMPDAELWIVGDGGLRPQLERMAGEGVRFWGTVSEKMKADLITQSRALVMPSLKEGFGLAYVEAMRLGRPCLVSTIDAGREVVTSAAGEFVDPSNSSALTDAVLRLLTINSTWTNRSLAARESYAASFTASAYQLRLIACLSRLKSRNEY